MSDDALRQLLALRHAHPHRVLGAHRVGGAVLFRTLRPDAKNVDVVTGNQHIRLHPRADLPGIFEARVDGTPSHDYRLLIQTVDGQTVETRDPYAFSPTLGDHDLHFVGEGKHRRLWERLGAHPQQHEGCRGTSFSVWAPNAVSVSVVGDFNRWDGRVHAMRSIGSSGIWEIFIPDVGEGARYKFEIRLTEGPPFLKIDPLAFRTEVPPLTASIVHDPTHYQWGDRSFVASRIERSRLSKPLSIYEVHLGSWARVPEEGDRSLTYRELAPRLAAHVRKLGFNHVELMPVAEHPFGGSWGYQVTSYYAPTARYGHPDDFRFLVDTLHQHGIGVIVDWVPGHFPRDEWALTQFDGTALYEHSDRHKGEHPDWGTLIFNFGRHEVRNFLIANALFWIDQYHVDGLRVDAVASMLYLDYSRSPGEWTPNQFGGRENEEAIAFLRELNDTVQSTYPGVAVMAEESTSWTGVSRPTSNGGLGFSHKWNMGWMHDTLKYFEKDPIHRKFHHHQLTFGLLYAYTENFVLPLSHDEVVHGKRSLLSKMPGDDWQKFANLRALYGWMWAHPGKKLLFMGGEFAQWNEWNHDRSLDWHLLDSEPHQQMMDLVAELNRLLRAEGSLFEADFDPSGFQWIQTDNADSNVYAFVRRAKNSFREIVCVANLSPVVRREWQVGVPTGGYWAEILNTDLARFGGSNVCNAPQRTSRKPWDGQPGSITLNLPPLAVLWLAPIDPPAK